MSFCLQNDREGHAPPLQGVRCDGSINRNLKTAGCVCILLFYIRESIIFGPSADGAGLGEEAFETATAMTAKAEALPTLLGEGFQAGEQPPHAGISVIPVTQSGTEDHAGIVETEGAVVLGADRNHVLPLSHIALAVIIFANGNDSAV